MWEWTRSLAKGYPYDPTDGREDPKVGGDRVLRGGSMEDFSWGVRCAARVGYSPDYWDFNLGFRLVVAPNL